MDPVVRAAWTAISAAEESYKRAKEQEKAQEEAPEPKGEKPAK